MNLNRQYIKGASLGQAKSRGSKEQRIMQAHAKLALPPKVGLYVYSVVMNG